MTFAAPQVLWLCPIGATLLLSVWWWSERRRQAALGAFAAPPTRARIAPPEGWLGRQLRRFGILLAVMLLVVAAARPQWGQDTEILRRRGVDVVLIVDTSLSMMAGDGDPRLHAARRAVADLTSRLIADRIGVVAFAGDAQILCPLTLDHGAVRLLVGSADADLLPTPGSDLGRGLRKANTLFQRDEHRFKVMVLLSDGEDHAGSALTAASQVAAEGVVLHAIGFGRSEGESIPLMRDGRPEGRKRDSAGNIVLTRLDVGLLQRVAAQGHGLYVPASAGAVGLDSIASAIEAMERRELSEGTAVRLQERFAIPLAGAFLLLALEALVGVLRPGGLAPVLVHRRQSEGDGVPLAVLIGLLTAGCAVQPRLALADDVQQGMLESSAGRHDAAVEAFDRALAKAPTNARLRYDLGTALLRSGRLDEAEIELRRAAIDGPPEVQVRAHYNRGHILFERGVQARGRGADGDEALVAALAAFREALRLSPADRDIKHNYERALGELRKQPPDAPPPRPSPTPATSDPDAQDPGPQPPPQGPVEPPPTMSEEEAGRLLDALGQQESSERRGRAGTDRPEPPQGKDW